MGRPADFYRQLEPERLAEHIVAMSRRDIRDLVDESWSASTPSSGTTCPHRARDRRARVQESLPAVVREVTEQVGANIDQLLDIKLMVIRRIDPALANRVFLEVGRRELTFIQNFGFVCGLVLGIPLVLVTRAFPRGGSCPCWA